MTHSTILVLNPRRTQGGGLVNLCVPTEFRFCYWLNVCFFKILPMYIFVCTHVSSPDWLGHTNRLLIASSCSPTLLQTRCGKLPSVQVSSPQISCGGFLFTSYFLYSTEQAWPLVYVLGLEVHIFLTLGGKSVILNLWRTAWNLNWHTGPVSWNETLQAPGMDRSSSGEAATAYPWCVFVSLSAFDYL